MDYYQSSISQLKGLGFGLIFLFCPVSVFAENIDELHRGEGDPGLQAGEVSRPTEDPSLKARSGLIAPSLGRGIDWGPEIQIAVPQPLQVGVEMTCRGDLIFCHPDWRYFADTGFFWIPLNGTLQSIRLFNFQAGTRYSPFEFPLMFSFGVGYRSLTLSAVAKGSLSAFTVDGAPVASHADLNFSTFFVSPSILYRIMISEQLSLDWELGVQIALLGSGSLVFVNQETGENSNNSDLLAVDSGAPLNRIAMFALPAVTLARFVWRF